MGTISILDGLVLTIVSMLVVFLILGAIWGLVELVAKIMPEPTTATETTRTSFKPKPSIAVDTESSVHLAPNAQLQKIAEIMALIIASEDQPNKKFEIVESKRVK